MDIENKVLRGFKTSPNIYVPDIEQVLGIKFDPIPSRVEWSLRNRVAALIFARQYPKIFNMLGSGLLGVGKWAGKSIPEYNLYLDKTHVPYIGFHENGHLLVSQIDPSFNVDSFKKEGPRIAAIKSCFDEGISDWIAIKTALKSQDDPTRLDAIWHHNNNLSRRPPRNGGVLTRDSDKVKELFPKLIESIHLNEQSLAREQEVQSSSSKTDINWREAGNAWAELKVASKGLRTSIEAGKIMIAVRYSVGYYFCLQAMKSLEKRRKTADALVILINNPPTTLDHLRNPQSYVQSIE